MSQDTQENPFRTLGLTPCYEINQDQVQHAYLERLALAHPDAGELAGVERGNEHDAAALNQARDTLLSHERRAVALLALLGGPDASACKDLPDGFLMEIMGRREEIEEQLSAGGEDARQRWEDWAQDERARYRQSVGALFAALGEGRSAESLSRIRIELNAWRYIERLIEQLDPEYDPARADFR